MYIQFKNKEVYFRLALITCMIKASLFSHSAFAEEYRFDNNLLAGSGFAKGISLEKFNDTEVIIAPGQQNLDLVLNGTKIKSQVPVKFQKINPTDKSAQLCLDAELIKLLQLKIQPSSLPQVPCLSLADITRQGSWRIKPSTLSVEFSIPQIMLNPPASRLYPGCRMGCGGAAVIFTP